MDALTIVIEVMFLVFLVINHILHKKMFKMMNELLKQKEDLVIRNIKLTKKETEIKKILDKAKATNEFAVLTVNKIKRVLFNDLESEK